MKKLKYILGIQNFANIDSGASIIKCSNDGKILDYIAISEERLIRKKYPYTFPFYSIDYCMNYFKIKKLDEIDLLVSDWIRIKRWKNSGPSYNVNEFDYLKDIFKFDVKKIKIINHHLAHAASVFYTSGFSKSSILIVDGNGSDLETTSYYKAENFNIELMENYKFHGVGACYGAVTKRILNLGKGGEGKTMGLAPYGYKYRNHNKFKIEPKFNGIKNDFSNFMTRMPFSDALNQIDPKYRTKIIKKSFKKCNNINNLTNKYYSSIAFELQKKTEKTLIHLGNDLHNKTKNKNLCIAGGVGLNSVSNKKILDKTNFKNIFIFPACSDAGIPFGLALWGYYNLKNIGSFKRKKIIFNNAYFGKKYSSAYIANCLKKYNINFKITSSKEVATKIAKGKIVGCFQGKSEYGPRALGNRSILADSRKKNMKDILNKRVKHRESFRPFAPSILEEYTKDYFDLNCKSPYMLLIAKVKKQNIVPAVTHVDGTARIHTVSKNSNKLFYSLINEFRKITGVPCILNTSFNDAGDPIVETPEDALETFFKCDIDYLYIDMYLISKNENLNFKKLYKKISNDISVNIDLKRKKLLKNFFKNYSSKDCKNFIHKNNKKSLSILLERCKLDLEKKISFWKKNNKKILIVGTEDHTKKLYQYFKDFSKLNISGFVKYFDKFDKDPNIKVNLKKIKLSDVIKADFDELLISSYEYNFEIINYLSNLSIKYYAIYDNTSRNFYDIFERKFLYNFKKNKL